MTSSWSRRDVMQVLGVALSTGFVGCTQDLDSDGTVTPSPTADSFITDLSSAIDALSFSAMVVEQASSSSPTQFRVALRNTSDQTLHLRWGQNIFYTAGSHERAAGLLVVPTDSAAGGEQSGGCWRYDESQPGIQAVATRGRLQPGDRVSALFNIYDDPTIEGCFPVGEYAERDRINLFNPDQPDSENVGTISLKVVITVDPDRKFSFAGKIPG